MTVAARIARPPPDRFVRLVASRRLRSDPDRVAAMLAADPPWENLRAEPSESPDLRRYAIDLRLRLAGDSPALATFSKAAYLDLGNPRRTARGWDVELQWRASTAAPLFPVFSGTLAIVADELRIDGLYAPPGGLVGRVADRMLLHVAANGTARWLLGAIDRAALAAGG
jgi:hypothetical protein